jgi:hypothetical protein
LEIVGPEFLPKKNRIGRKTKMALYILLCFGVFMMSISIGWFLYDLFKGIKYSSPEDRPPIFGSLVFIGIIWVIFLFFGKLYLEEPTDGRRPVAITKYSKDIVSVKSTTSVDGVFILECGGVGSSRYYIYYERQDDGSLQQKQIDIENVSIFEEENCKPRIEW